MASTSERGTWGSRLGFVLAAAGSAVGLGNIWGFPTRVGQGGGAAFVLVYLVCVSLICAPIMMAELALGRRTQRNPIGAFKTLFPQSAWWIVGALAILASIGNLSFYSVIAGWTIAYIGFTATKTVAVGDGSQAIGAFFNSFTANVGKACLGSIRISSVWCGSSGTTTPFPLWGSSFASSWVTFGKPTRLWKNCSRTMLGFRGHGFGVC